MTYRLTVVALLIGLAWPGVLAAQAPPPGLPPPGLQLARGFVDRIVRVIGRQVPGLPGESGYGLVVGERSGTQGGIALIVVVPDHLVRDPQRADARFDPPSVIFMADPAHPVRARLLEERLAPDDGDVAVLAVPKPPGYRSRPAAAANTGLLIQGAPAWQVGRPNDWTPDATPGRFAQREQAGWLAFEGLDNAPAATGAPVTTERGLAGIIAGASGPGRQLALVVPVELIAIRLRGWGLPFDFSTPDGSAVVAGTRLAAGAAPAPAAQPADRPTALVAMLPAEAAARTSWTPPGARVSPSMNAPARLYGAARPNAPQIGTLPPGRSLPQMLLTTGAYEITRKLDGGAWFLIEIGGQPIGYVAGSDVVEIWPIQGMSGMAGGKVVREWSGPGGKTAVLRDIGTAFELETSVTCKAAFCDSIVVFTPAPPAAGAIVPTFQAQPFAGAWKEGDVVSLRLQLPRRVVETGAARLMACIGRDDDCDLQALLPPA